MVAHTLAVARATRQGSSSTQREKLTLAVLPLTAQTQSAGVSWFDGRITTTKETATQCTQSLFKNKEICKCPDFFASPPHSSGLKHYLFSPQRHGPVTLKTNFLKRQTARKVTMERCF